MEQDTVDISLWQPDFVLVSRKHKRIIMIAILVPKLPLDVLIAQMEEAYRQKQQKYTPFLSGLQQYNHAGWSIGILQLVIGIIGLADTKHFNVALAFLDIPTPKWKEIIEDSVLESVSAFAYMHKMR